MREGLHWWVDVLCDVWNALMCILLGHPLPTKFTLDYAACPRCGTRLW